MTIAKDETLQDRLPPTLDAGGVRVTPTGTVTVAGPLTDPQLRAAPVAVDSELPAAAVPTSNDLNIPVPAVAGRMQGWETSTSRWRMMAAARTDGTGHTPADTLAATQHLYDTSTAKAMPVVSAASAGDSSAGAGSMSVAPMLHNGATWERARAASREWVTLLASAPRTASASTPTLALPGGIRGVAVMLEVQAQPATAGAAVTMGVYTSGPNSVWLATLPPTTDAPDTGRRVTVPAATDPQGVHHLLLVIHPDARPIRPVSSFLSSQALQMLVPPLLALDVGHSAGGASWTYSLHYKFLI